MTICCAFDYMCPLVSTSGDVQPTATTIDNNNTTPGTMSWCKCIDKHGAVFKTLLNINFPITV